jgi:hypothetical protein
LREGDHLEDPGIGGRTILKFIFERWWSKEWIDLAQYRDRWRAPVNTVMNLRSSIKCGEFLE